MPYRVRCSDETGVIDLVFFRGDKKYLQGVLPIGETRIVSGKVDYYRGEPQMTHPDHILTDEEFADLPPYEPVYPLTAGLTQKTIVESCGAGCGAGDRFARVAGCLLAEAAGLAALGGGIA